VPVVSEARQKAEDIANSILKDNPDARPIIYIGGSTYVVSEAINERD
jgi:hypothetical protein